DVYHRQIHRDPPHDRRAPAMHQRAPSVGESTRQPIPVADPQRGPALPPRRTVRSTVTDGGPRRYLADHDDPRPYREYYLRPWEVCSTISRTPHLRDRIAAVEEEPRPDRVAAVLREPEESRAIRRVDHSPDTVGL